MKRIKHPLTKGEYEKEIARCEAGLEKLKLAPWNPRNYGAQNKWLARISQLQGELKFLITL